MRITTKLIIVLSAILALLIGGCTPSNEPIDISDPFIGGNGGLFMSFEQGMPPPEIFDDGKYPFSVGVRLENLGEADVGYESPSQAPTENPYVNITLVGINPDHFNISQADMSLSFNLSFDPKIGLKGAHKNFDGTILPGEIFTTIFEGLNYEQDLHGNDMITLRAELCYDYQTFSSTKICIKDNVLENIDDDSICTLNGEKYPKNSGSPVHVTSVTETPLGNSKIQIHFVIEHVGSGTIYKRTSPNYCDTSVANYDRNIVWVKTYIGDGSDPTAGEAVSCSQFAGSSQGEVKLYQGAPTPVTCSIDLDTLGASGIYTDLFHIDLDYKYGQFIDTQLLIKDVTT